MSQIVVRSLDPSTETLSVGGEHAESIGDGRFVVPLRLWSLVKQALVGVFEEVGPHDPAPSPPPPKPASKSAAPSSPARSAVQEAPGEAGPPQA